MATTTDILAFLKADQEARKIEREEERQLRVKERKEDMKEILRVLQTTILQEVRKQVEPVEARLELQEKVNKDLYEQLSVAKKDIELLRKSVRDPQEQVCPPSLPEADPFRGQQVNINESECGTPLEELCASARKVIGFSPIEPRMLDMQMQNYGARNIEETKLMEIRSYLKCELKLPPSEIEKLSIRRIFPPAKQDWNVLYVEFSCPTEVDTIFMHTKNMNKPDHRATQWIPKQMYERFRGVESWAYNIRKEQGLKTRVRIGKSDFVLKTRSKNSQVWSTSQLPCTLPAIDATSRSSI